MKKLIAFTTDFSLLKWEEREIRLAYGGGDLHPVPPNSWLVVCYPRDWTAAKKLLESLGVTVLPALHDPATPVGADVAVKLPGGIAANDVAFTAAAKLHAHLNWPPLDPNAA